MTTLAIPFPSRLYRLAFKLILLGFAMTLIDVRVNHGLDLVPDCVGYFVITLAAISLQPLDRASDRTRRMWIVATGVLFVSSPLLTPPISLLPNALTVPLVIAYAAAVPVTLVMFVRLLLGARRLVSR